MDINPFVDLFSSMAAVSPFELAVWDEKRCLYSSVKSGLKKPETESIEKLAAKVIRQDRFHCVTVEDRYAAFGAPIYKEDTVMGALIAFGADLGHAAPGQGLARAMDRQAAQMAAFLKNVSKMMDTLWGSYRETEEMAEDLSMYFEDLSLYSRTTSQFRALRFSETMLKEIVAELLETMRIEMVFVRFADRQEFNMRLSDQKIADKLPDIDAFVEKLVRHIPPGAADMEDNFFVVNDSSGSPVYGKLHSEPFRFLAVPVKDKETFYGWIGLLSFNFQEIFRRSELSLASSIAQQLAAAISNTDLYHDLEEFVINMVKSLVFTIEAKDVYTRGHSERVNYFCMLMAQELGLDKENQNALNWASILHDIGKIGIPEKILNKPGRLDEKEFATIKEHPEKGRNILRPLKQLSASIPGILHHHERYDGSGYPAGLKGEKIPLPARIIAVADTFDAISSDRAYRNAKSHQKAMQIINEGAGSQLDPDLVACFQTVYHSVFQSRESA